MRKRRGKNLQGGGAAPAAKSVKKEKDEALPLRPRLKIGQ